MAAKSYVGHNVKPGSPALFASLYMKEAEKITENWGQMEIVMASVWDNKGGKQRAGNGESVHGSLVSEDQKVSPWDATLASTVMLVWKEIFLNCLQMKPDF